MRTQKIHKGKIWFGVLIGLHFSLLSYSQRPNREETISYINKKLSPVCSVVVKSGDIIATYFDEGGQRIREDRVAIGNLDTLVRYNVKENVFIIPTIKGCEECVTRKLIVQKVKRFYSRLSFTMEGSDKEIKGLRKALVHLIRIGSEFRYHDEISFEE